MKIIDFSPSTAPSLDEQRDALQKGLGRAMRWAEAGCLADGPLLDACLTDQRYDMQVEDSRTEWLWRMIEIVDAKDRFRVPILHALYELAEERSAYQLCELGCHYAQTGDEAFRTRLYEIVESRPFADCPLLGESELLRLDGHEALVFAARLRGEELVARDWDWHDGSFVDEAVEILGESEVLNRLSDSDDKRLHRFRDLWDRDVQKREQRTQPTHKERMRSISVSDILSEASKKKPSLAFFRGWGMHAADSDLQTVLDTLWVSVEPAELVCLLRVFSNRALPEFDPRLIELCDHDDEEVRRWAFNALEKNTDPAIHHFALHRLQHGDHQAIGLFVKNYEQSDEQTILNCIELPSDQFDLHSILFDVIKVLENNDEADASQLGVVAYASTPCETCRLYAARWLHQHHFAPDWLIEECRFDSVDDCRKLGEDTNSTAEEQET